MQPVKVVKIKTKKEIVKEPYPGWRKQATTVDAPTAEDKKRERDMGELLEKEDFFGQKKAEERLARLNKKAVADTRSDAAVKKMNALIAAKIKAEKEKKK
jgi:hypothetical protein